MNTLKQVSMFLGAPKIKRDMKATVITAAMLVGLVALPSCSDMASLSSAPSSTMGSVAQVVPGTVVSARMVQVDASSTDKSLGTGFGAVIGAGAGSLLGRGKGQLVSTLGFGTVGALAGRAIGKEAGKTTAQELIIRADGSKAQYRVTQPIYQQIGAILEGTHGNLEIGGSGSKFVPDGM